VNGDGFADVIVSASVPDSPPSRRGAYLFLGSASGIPNGTQADAQTVLSDPFPNDSDNFTSALASGDVNGDGYDDVVVGATSDSAGQFRGAAYVFLGSATGVPDGTAVTAAAKLQSPGVILGPDDQFGAHVASADVNGDGSDEVLVGAPDYENGAGPIEELQLDEGALFVFPEPGFGLSLASGAAAVAALARRRMRNTGHR
jgi:hypothetical protein